VARVAPKFKPKDWVIAVCCLCGYRTLRTYQTMQGYLCPACGSGNIDLKEAPDP